MLETKDREIDGIEFRYQPMMATPARELFDELLQKYGPAVAAAIEALEKAEGLNLEADAAAMIGSVTSSIGGGLREIAFATSPQFHKKIVDKLQKQTLFKNEEGEFKRLEKADIELMFGTKLLTEAKWIGFCLEVQYADFLELLKTGAMRALAVKATANASRFDFQKISTGTSPE